MTLVVSNLKRASPVPTLEVNDVRDAKSLSGRPDAVLKTSTSVPPSRPTTPVSSKSTSNSYPRFHIILPTMFSHAPYLLLAFNYGRGRSNNICFTPTLPSDSSFANSIPLPDIFHSYSIHQFLFPFPSQIAFSSLKLISENVYCPQLHSYE